jgi:predicted CXXCH cytochrome family protein
VLFLSCLAALVAGVPARAEEQEEEVTKEACLACHAMEDFADEGARSLVVKQEDYATSLHAALQCTTCHTDATEVPHAERLRKVGPEACAMCHDEVVTAYRASVHGYSRTVGLSDVGPSEAAACTSCHGSPHYARRSSDPNSPVYPLTLPHTCGACHGDPELAKRHGIPVVNAYQMYMDSIHGRALTRSGLLVSANCSSCHGAHEIRPKEDPESKVFRGNIPSTCGTCHAGITDLYFSGIHGQAHRGGNVEAPVCVDCHSAHQIARVETAPWKLQIVRECGACHEESLKTYRDTLHGQVTNLGFTVVARCSDCHGSHEVLPASDRKSMIAPANLVTTCQKCHPSANENFVQFSPHADAQDPEKSPFLYYTAWLMNALIISVFSFFGVHTALWFGRSLAERRRRPRAAASKQNEEREE